MPVSSPKQKIGFVPANRGAFSPILATKMRRQALEVFSNMNIDVIVPSEDQTKLGCVENVAEAELAAKLFRAADVDAIVIGAVNFGDEQAAALAVRQARLNVPVLLFGCQEEEVLTRQTSRRDAFCGILSIGETLRQVGAKYSVGTRPICFPKDGSFQKDMDWFLRVTRVVNGIRRARYGQIGARPDAFWTCRFDEKQLQRLGPTTVTLDLSEVIGACNQMLDDDPEVQRIAADIKGWADTSTVKDASVIRSAKLEVFLRSWRKANAIDAFAIQCWTSIQKNYGVCSCTTMSRFGDEGLPSACEADILGTLSMHACLLASGSPAALADWNNLHNEDDELANLWHCGVFPSAFGKEKPKIALHTIMAAAGEVAPANAEGVVELVAKEGPVTLCRVTQDADGSWKVLIEQGAIEDNPAVTFGAYGWCRIPGLQHLYRNVLLRHFPHHVAMTEGTHASVLWEAFGNYLDFQVFHGKQNVPGLYVSASPF